MSPTEKLQRKITARDAANRLLARLTLGAVLGAIAGVGLFGYVSAQTVPGNSSSTTGTTASTAGTSSASSSTASTSSSSTSDGGLSAGSASSSSSGSAVAVTGGS